MYEPKKRDLTKWFMYKKAGIMWFGYNLVVSRYDLVVMT